MQDKIHGNSKRQRIDVSAERSLSRVLIVDDDAFFSKILCAQLEIQGFSAISIAENGERALQQLERVGADMALIFCDLQMPQMDGVEFLRNLAGINYSGNLVLMSGEDNRILHSAQKLANAHALNILGVLSKPVTPLQIKKILDSRLTPGASLLNAAAKRYSAAELQRAISQGELVNVYQPKVDVTSGEIVGVETLVRWQHPKDGMVYPEQFIGVAEQYRLIDELTLVVLNNALSQARIWQDMRIQLHISVNISMDNLTSLDFPDRLADIATKAGVPLAGLILEVTESRLMNNPLASIDILTRLRLKGVSLSIDDFGTGHSSLAQLRDIPFDELKIDQGFVRGACHDESLQAILNASIGMANQLGITSVAEGVESAEDWDFLRSTGCDLAQGHFIAKPMPAIEITALLTD